MTDTKQLLLQRAMLPNSLSSGELNTKYGEANLYKALQQAIRSTLYICGSVTMVWLLWFAAVRICILKYLIWVNYCFFKSHPQKPQSSIRGYLGPCFSFLGQLEIRLNLKESALYTFSSSGHFSLRCCKVRLVILSESKCNVQSQPEGMIRRVNTDSVSEGVH